MLSSPRVFGVTDAGAAAPRVTAPSFLAVGRRDTAFVQEVRLLYRATAAKRKELLVVDSSGHGTQLLDPSWAPASFKAKLLAFIVAAFQ